MKKDRYEWVALRMTAQEKKALKEAAARESRTVSNYIRLLIEQAQEVKK